MVKAECLIDHPPCHPCLPPPQTVDQRIAEGRTPLWAERMGLSGSRQGPQSATIYGHRSEYKPSQKTEARSMVSGAQGGG